MTSLRDRLLDRCGLPADCGWTDDMLVDHIDLGLRHNAPTVPADDSPEAKNTAIVRDLAWAINCHSLDVLAAMPDDLLGRYLLSVIHGLAWSQLQRDKRAAS